MNTELYLVRFYDIYGGKAYRNKLSAFQALIKAYLDNIDSWGMEVDDIKKDLRTLVEDDWIEDFGEIVNIELVEGE